MEGVLLAGFSREESSSRILIDKLDVMSIASFKRYYTTQITQEW
jgi:hypothetical protein